MRHPDDSEHLLAAQQLLQDLARLRRDVEKEAVASSDRNVGPLYMQGRYMARAARWSEAIRSADDMLAAAEAHLARYADMMFPPLSEPEELTAAKDDA